MKHLKVIESLIANGDADVSAQGLELLVSQSPTARELKAMVLPMLRASSHDRNRVASRIIRRLTQTGRHRRLMTVLRNTARRIAFKKPGGWRAFLVTAEQGSFSAAARAMGVSQPTVRRQVTALEADTAIRNVRPTQPDLFAKKIRDTRAHLYASG